MWRIHTVSYILDSNAACAADLVAACRDNKHAIHVLMTVLVSANANPPMESLRSSD